MLNILGGWSDGRDAARLLLESWDLLPWSDVQSGGRSTLPSVRGLARLESRHLPRLGSLVSQRHAPLNLAALVITLHSPLLRLGALEVLDEVLVNLAHWKFLVHEVHDLVSPVDGQSLESLDEHHLIGALELIVVVKEESVVGREAEAVHDAVDVLVLGSHHDRRRGDEPELVPNGVAGSDEPLHRLENVGLFVLQKFRTLVGVHHLFGALDGLRDVELAIMMPVGILYIDSGVPEARPVLEDLRASGVDDDLDVVSLGPHVLVCGFHIGVEQEAIEIFDGVDWLFHPL
mmetsp:Transcript_5060/g.8139  ORF Transcript_5060/g.8139 Transcript_5060/m.8139 type:complete len:289 (-) Transcript_5060:1382-2248(-)